MASAFVFLAGAALLVVAVRGWQPGLPVRAALGYVALVAAFFAAPLFTGALQLPTDIAYQWRPYREIVEGTVRPQNPLLSDTLFEQIPFHALVRRRFRALEAPLWSHELATGQPLLGNSQSAPFAPLHLLALPLPLLSALSVSAAWSVLLTLLLMHCLARRLGAGAWGAATAAVAVGFSTFFVAWIYNTVGMVAPWVPGVLLGLLLLRRGERGGFAGLVACGLGLILSGHPEIVAVTALAALPIALSLLVFKPGGRWRFLGRLAAAALLTGGLAAPALLPFLEALPRSDRMAAVLHWEIREPPRFEPRTLLPLLDPLAFGSPRDGNWNGPDNFNETCSVYAGLVPLALAVAGAILWRGRILALLGGGLLALATALRVPPFYTMATALPLLQSGNLARLRLFWVIAVALAAGLSVERLAGERSGRKVGAILLATAGLALALLPPPGPAGSAPWERAWWGFALGAAAAALLTLTLPRLRRAFLPTVLAGLAVELFLFGARYSPTPGPAFDLAPPPALADLVRRAEAPGPPFRVLAEGGDLAPNLAAFSGLWDPRGSDPMAPFDAARFVRRRLKVGKGRELDAEVAVEALGVRFALTGHRRHLPPPWRPVFDDQGGKVWENPAALPLFFFPHRFERMDDAEAIRLALTSLDFRELGVAAGRPAPPVPQTGEVSAIRARSNGFDLEVRSPAGGTVASSVSYLPGWRSRIDGREGAVFEVNSAFVGFIVPPGTHRVQLDYRPASWRLGLLLAALASLAALGGLAGAIARRRAPKPSGSAPD